MKRLLSSAAVLSLCLAGCSAEHRHTDTFCDYGSARRSVVSPFMGAAGVGSYCLEFTRAREPLSATRLVYTEPERRAAIGAIVDRLLQHRLATSDVTLGGKSVYFDAGMTDDELAEADNALEILAGVSMVGNSAQRRCANWIPWRDRMLALAAQYPQPVPPPPGHRVDEAPPGR